MVERADGHPDTSERPAHSDGVDAEGAVCVASQLVHGAALPQATVEVDEGGVSRPDAELSTGGDCVPEGQ